MSQDVIRAQKRMHEALNEDGARRAHDFSAQVSDKTISALFHVCSTIGLGVKDFVDIAVVGERNLKQREHYIFYDSYIKLQLLTTSRRIVSTSSRRSAVPSVLDALSVAPRSLL